MKAFRSVEFIAACLGLAALALPAAGQEDKAFTDFIQLVELRDSEKTDDLVKACLKFKKDHPDSVAVPTVLFYCGKAAYDLKDYDAAIDATTKLIDNHESFAKLAEVYMLRGEAHRLKDEWVEALPDFELAYAGFQKEENGEAPHALYHVVQGQQETGATDEAKKSFDLLVSGFPGSKYIESAGQVVGDASAAPIKPKAPKKEAAFSPGDEAPSMSFFQLDDNTEKSLADFKGKVVVVDFWASWCGPCQAPMAKMQTYGEAHPEWGDKVKLVALSIDNKAETAAKHLTDKGWDKTYNVWAGDGGFKSAAPVAYKVRGIPTACVIDQEGKIAAYGHPASLDISKIVSDLLK